MMGLPLKGHRGHYLGIRGSFLTRTLWCRQSLEQPLVWFQDGLAHTTSDLGAGPASHINDLVLTAWKPKFGGGARRKHCWTYSHQE